MNVTTLHVQTVKVAGTGLLYKLHRWRKVEKSGGSAAEKFILFHYFWHIFSRWRARGNELSRAEQGASKATSGDLTAT